MLGLLRAVLVPLLLTSPGDSLRAAGRLEEALPLLISETAERPTDDWLAYRLAWTLNRLEMYGGAAEAAGRAWELDPADRWYLAELMKALRGTGDLAGVIELSPFVRGGGACRYHLAAAERDSGISPSPSAEWLARAVSSPDDSTAADACAWLSVLLAGDVPPDSVLALRRTALELDGSSAFYACLLAEAAAEADSVRLCSEVLRGLRTEASGSYGYWGAMAALAEAEESPLRRIWALRRALESRDCPQSRRDLGWALYLHGRDLLRGGERTASRELLERASGLRAGASAEPETFSVLADSLLRLLDEYESAAARG